jgi:hypothetical protein
MGVAWFLVQLVFVGLLTFFVWNKYVNWQKQHPLVSISTFIGWYFSFLIILVLPLDVAIVSFLNLIMHCPNFQTFYYKCQLDEHRLNNHTDPSSHAANISLNCEEPKGYLNDSFLLSWWRIVYWISQLLTWILLPIMQSYTSAGDFTFVGKFRSALVGTLLIFPYFIFVCLVQQCSILRNLRMSIYFPPILCAFKRFIIELVSHF